MYQQETIVAISTAQGTAGIGIIRISGEDAFDIARKIFKSKTDFDKIESHTIKYGKLIDPSDGETIDEVLLSKMVKPNTFTRENIIEINCHGGIVVLRKALELVTRMGARLAEPGEFTKRAFLNGRIDLSQAEAVIDVINSKTEESARAAVEQLEGRLSKEIHLVRQQLIKLIAHIEVTLDYPEHDIEEITGAMVFGEIKEICEKLNNIIKGFDKGRIIREGISVVIAGRPNVGKSSLLNALSGKNKAIVTDVPGTTRDIIEEYININGIPVKVIDTAGIRHTTDLVESIGVERAQREISNADLLIVMMDAGDGIKDDDLELLRSERSNKVIYIVNKVDLVEAKDVVEILKRLNVELKNKNNSETSIISTSLKENIGIDELENKITELFLGGEVKANSDIIVTNVRHKVLIDKAIDSIEEAEKAYENQMPLDCLSIDIKNAADYLGQITGESINEDVMNEIFSKFCIGK